LRPDSLLALTKIRDLDLSEATSFGQHLHLSAASGLVCADPYFYVVADDELHLGVFRSSDTKPGHLIRIFAGELPAGKNKRKAHKPDTETLMRLPPFAGYPDGALFALSSGSKRKRCRGALLALNARSVAGESPCIIDLATLFATLDDHIDGLNIEGGIINGNEWWLLQRGNKRDGCNAIIRYPLSTLFDLLSARDDTADMTPSWSHQWNPFVLYRWRRFAEWRYRV
jgi:hypothetical protein